MFPGFGEDSFRNPIGPSGNGPLGKNGRGGPQHLLDETGSLDLARDQCRRDYVEQMDSQIHEAHEYMGRLVQQVLLRETTLRNAVRDRQILERLKDIRHKSYIEDIRALEMKRMDFAASSIFRRSNP